MTTDDGITAIIVLVVFVILPLAVAHRLEKKNNKISSFKKNFQKIETRFENFSKRIN